MSTEKLSPISRHYPPASLLYSESHHPPICLLDQGIARTSPQRPKRSWARSKRISLGCLEWRAANNTKSHLDFPYRGPERLLCESPHPLIPTANTSTCDSVLSQPLTNKSRGGLYKRDRSKIGSGADALLRRLRMKSMLKSGRKTYDNDPTLSGSHPTRSLSVPRADDQSNYAFPSNFVSETHSDGGRSVLSVKSAPEFAEDASLSAQYSVAEEVYRWFPVMANTVDQSAAGCSSNLNQFVPLADTMQSQNVLSGHLYPSHVLRFPHNISKTENSLFRPLSQPSFFQASCQWNSEESETRLSALSNPPFPDIKALQVTQQDRSLDFTRETIYQVPSLSHGVSPLRPDLRRDISSYWPNHSSLDCQSPQRPLRTCFLSNQKCPVLQDQRQFSSNSNHLNTACVYSPRAEFATSQTHWAYVPTVNAVGNCYPVHYTGQPNAPQLAKIDDQYLTGPLQRHAHKQTDAQVPAAHAEFSHSAALSVDKPVLPTRPDSLLSGSSLTADSSSASESIPNSSSSRDSALGGNSKHRAFGINNFNNELSSTLESLKPLPTHFNEYQGIAADLIPSVERQHSTDFRVMRSKFSVAPTLLDVNHPPTPRRNVMANLSVTNTTAPLKPSQRVRAERKNSSYVNAALYQVPIGQTGDNRAIGSFTSPTAWAQLLPYRMSTVPQNLSERLKKSETLPNDVWVHMQHSCNGIEREHKTIDCLNSICATNDFHKTVRSRSPPPRPPVRTSSQKQATMINPKCPVGNLHARSTSNTAMPCVSDHVTQTRDFFVATPDQFDDNSVLCRYSQLYALPFNPKSSFLPKVTREQLPPGTTEQAVTQLERLHLTS